MITAGIDAGSRAIKAVLLNRETKEVIAHGVVDQGLNQAELAEQLLNDLLSSAGHSRDDLKFTVATGYGRDTMGFANMSVTEITCHGYGVFHMHPEAKTVVDIGGQDSKVLRLGNRGRVKDFVMNDRCAAGTGRFLEVVSERLEVPLEDLGKISNGAGNPSTISSMCVVFAETEIVGLMAQGESQENIVAGVCNSIASRVTSMAGKKVEEPILFAGGVSRIEGMADVLTKTVGKTVSVADNPQITGALGAALIAAAKAE